MLKPHDIVVALKLAIDSIFSYQKYSKDLFLSSSTIHRSIKQLELSGFIYDDNGSPHLNRKILFDFCTQIHRVFPAKLGALSYGIPTASRPAGTFRDYEGESCHYPIWKFHKKFARGFIINPLYPTLPKACFRDPDLYDLIRLIDAIRLGEGFFEFRSARRWLEMKLLRS